MKRSPELVFLSREHHVALELALRLRRATQADAEAVRRAAVEFWECDGQQHFRQEEELLLPALAAGTSTADPDIERVRIDHADLRSRFSNLSAGPGVGPEALRQLGQRLQDHVRFEERTLFERAQTELDPQQLAAIGREGPARGINVEDLERWTEAGATWRLVELFKDRVVIDMCQCSGELVERRSSVDPAVRAYARDALHADRSTDEPSGTSLPAISTRNES